jgi:FtsH-binding integral membrane protein
MFVEDLPVLLICVIVILLFVNPILMYYEKYTLLWYGLLVSVISFIVSSFIGMKICKDLNEAWNN